MGDKTDLWIRIGAAPAVSSRGWFSAALLEEHPAGTAWHRHSPNPAGTLSAGMLDLSTPGGLGLAAHPEERLLLRHRTREQLLQEARTPEQHPGQELLNNIQLQSQQRNTSISPKSKNRCDHLVSNVICCFQQISVSLGNKASVFGKTDTWGHPGKETGPTGCS